MENKPTTVSITLDENLYNDLNRASREYEASVVDCYYYIINGGSIDDAAFEYLFDDAVKSHYVYAKLKDTVSNDLVIPAVASAYDVNPDECSIYDSWNIPFDGSHKCTISNIKIFEGKQETTIYTADCPEEYIENVAKLKTRINIANEVISKLNSAALPEFADKTAKALRSRRLDMMSRDAANTTAFMRDFVSPKIEELGKSPSNLIWSINVNDKTFSLIEKASDSGIACTSCASCN